MEMVKKIIHYNKMANMAITDHNTEMAAKYLMKIHKLELKDRVEIGSYRLR